MCTAVSTEAMSSMMFVHMTGPLVEAFPYYGYENQRDKEYVAGMLMGPAAIPVYSSGEEVERTTKAAAAENAKTDALIKELSNISVPPYRARNRFNPLRGAQRALAMSRGGVVSTGMLGSGREGAKTLLGE